MGIFERATQILSANMNDFVDRLEHPDQMLRQALREMESTLATTSAAVARSIATEKLLGKQRDEHLAHQERWRQRAERAVAAGDESLARQAIGQRLEHERALAQLEQQLGRASETNLRLKRQLDALREKQASARIQLDLFSARQATAAAQQASTRIQRGGVTTTLARIDRFCREIEFAEAEIEAFLELQTSADTKLVEDFDRRAIDEAIEAELYQLQQGLRPESL